MARRLQAFSAASITTAESTTTLAKTTATLATRLPEKAASAPKASVTQASAAPTPHETVSQSSAVKNAQSCLRSISFSRSGLTEQLVYEGFSQAQAEYGVNAVGL